MDANARIASVAATTLSVAASSDGADFDQSNGSADAERIARYRLVIEEGPTSGSFVYKTLDSVTGEVIRQFPREQILQLAETGDYDTGTVIDTVA